MITCTQIGFAPRGSCDVNSRGAAQADLKWPIDPDLMPIVGRQLLHLIRGLSSLVPAEGTRRLTADEVAAVLPRGSNSQEDLRRFRAAFESASIDAAGQMSMRLRSPFHIETDEGLEVDLDTQVVGRAQPGRLTFDRGFKAVGRKVTKIEAATEGGKPKVKVTVIVLGMSIVQTFPVAPEGAAKSRRRS